MSPGTQILASLNKAANKQVMANKTAAKLVLGLWVAILMWFLVVDASWFVEQCPDCFYLRDIFQIRILTIAIHERSKTFDMLVHEVSKDLGVPCQHPRLVRWHKHRYWGLYYCAYPCINGTISVAPGVPDWYDQSVREKLKAMAEAHPSIREEFVQKVLRHEDREGIFFRQILKEITPPGTYPNTQPESAPSPTSDIDE